MFGIDFFEIVIIVVIGVIILGPEHMPRVALKIGKLSAQMRSAASQLGEAITQDEDVLNLKREIDKSRDGIDQHLKKGKSESQSLGARLNAAVLNETKTGNVTKTLAKARPETGQECAPHDELNTRVFDGVISDSKTDFASSQTQETLNGISVSPKAVECKTLFAAAQVQTYAEEETKISRADMPTLHGHCTKIQSPTPLNSLWLDLPNDKKQVQKLAKTHLLPEIVSRQTNKTRHRLAKAQNYDLENVKAHTFAKPIEDLGFLSSRTLSTAMSASGRQVRYPLQTAQTPAGQVKHVFLAPSKRPS